MDEINCDWKQLIKVLLPSEQSKTGSESRTGNRKDRNQNKAGEMKKETPCLNFNSPCSSVILIVSLILLVLIAQFGVGESYSPPQIGRNRAKEKEGRIISSTSIAKNNPISATEATRVEKVKAKWKDNLWAESVANLTLQESKKTAQENSTISTSAPRSHQISDVSSSRQISNSPTPTKPTFPFPDPDGDEPETKSQPDPAGHQGQVKSKVKGQGQGQPMTSLRTTNFHLDNQKPTRVPNLARTTFTADLSQFGQEYVLEYESEDGEKPLIISSTESSLKKYNQLGQEKASKRKKGSKSKSKLKTVSKTMTKSKSRPKVKVKGEKVKGQGQSKPTVDVDSYHKGSLKRHKNPQKSSKSKSKKHKTHKKSKSKYSTFGLPRATHRNRTEKGHPKRSTSKPKTSTSRVEISEETPSVESSESKETSSPESDEGSSVSLEETTEKTDKDRATLLADLSQYGQDVYLEYDSDELSDNGNSTRNRNNSLNIQFYPKTPVNLFTLLQTLTANMQPIKMASAAGGEMPSIPVKYNVNITNRVPVKINTPSTPFLFSLDLDSFFTRTAISLFYSTVAIAPLIYLMMGGLGSLGLGGLSIAPFGGRRLGRSMSRSISMGLVNVNGTLTSRGSNETTERFPIPVTESFLLDFLKDGIADGRKLAEPKADLKKN